MKRILVTGTGFIGSHIVEPFQGKCEIRVLDSFRTGRRSNLDGLNCELIEGDVKHSPACVDKLLATGFKPSWDFLRGLEVTVKSYVEALKAA